MADFSSMGAKAVSLAQLKVALERNNQQMSEVINQAVQNAIPEMATDEEVNAMLDEVFGTDSTDDSTEAATTEGA